MNTVGASEAKTHLSRLLKRVAKGERFPIEKHGVPVATLEPANPSRRKPAGEIIAELRQFRTGRRLDGMTIGEMTREGRR